MKMLKSSILKSSNGSAGATGSDAEGDGDALRVRGLVDGVERVDLERAADLIAGDVLEDVEHEQLVRAGAPRLARRERPPRFAAVDGDVALNRDALARH